MRAVLHIDMDAFFASVEQRDDPSLRGKPVLVGHRARRGVVLAASYEARPYGLRSAMPMAEALRRCPDVLVVPPRHHRYAEASAEVFAIFHRFTPLVEGLSVDEAFLDVTASRSLFGDGEAIARAIKTAVKAETGLIASAGVATTKFVAKVASDLGKPDGLLVVPPGEERAFLAPLPIERMWGVGPKTAPRLREMGFSTLGDLADASRATLEQLLGSWGEHVSALSRGVDPRPVDPDGEAKSIGAEETYAEDLTTREEIARKALELSARVAQRLVREGYFCRTVTLKLKLANFTLRTRQTTVPEVIADTDSIHRAALGLLDRLDLHGARVRLVGVSVGSLTSEPPARTLFPDVAAEKRRKLEGVLAQMTDRFGEATVRRATLLDPEDPSGRTRKPPSRH
jgi:DNA polymerase-4